MFALTVLLINKPQMVSSHTHSTLDTHSCLSRIEMLTHSCRCTLLNRKTHTALSAASINLTRSPNTRRERTPPLLRVRDATTPSKPVSVDRPSPSSERRPRPPRRLPSSLSATSARSADARSLVDASHSFLERKKTPRVRSFSELCVPPIDCN